MTPPTAGFILVVDDNPANLAILTQTLKREGYAVRVAVDGESVLEQVLDEPPVLILLDVMMPGIDGFETCRRLKSNPTVKEIPVVFMTALTDTDSKVHGFSLGAVDYITKPFNETEVLSRVKLHLQLQNLLQTLNGQNQRLKQEIEQRQKAEAELHHLNEELEQRVIRRTAALQQAQVKLVQQEKLSTLGELVTGIAHELRNPISCLTGNIEFIRDYSTHLLEHVALYQQALPEPGDAILNHAKTIDLGFIAQDLPKLMRSMQVSGDRIYNISDSLRTFARSDAQKQGNFNLHEGLDSTLLILKHRLQAQEMRPEITVTKTYGDLPEIVCYASQINQVFMNILANAVDALDEHFLAIGAKQEMENLPSLQIQIATDVEDDQAIVRIQDNAGGMVEDVRCHIFDEAYTTKTAGKGTGLGLSITRHIVVETHGGQINCESIPGQGTAFTLKLPIR